jgi:hypothetical protein
MHRQRRRCETVEVKMKLKSALLLLCVALLSFYAVGQQQRLTKKEVKSLIATATTSEDHLRIASYYRGVAQRYLARQKEHEAEEKEYRSNPRAYPSKLGLAEHCRQWAYLDGQSAQKALALAESHEKMAREVQNYQRNAPRQ